MTAQRPTPSILPIPSVRIPNLPAHVLKAYRLLEELAEAKRISTVEWETISRAITRRAPGLPREDGFVIPGWSLEGHITAHESDEVAE